MKVPKEPAFLRRVTYLCCLTDTQCSEMVSMLVRVGAPQAPPTKCEARGGPASCSYRVQQASPRPQQQRRRQRPCGRRHLAAAAAATAGAEAAAAASSYDGLLRWCIEQHQLPPLAVEPAALDGGFGMERPGFVASREVAQGEVVLQVPGDLAITSVDVDKDPPLAALAQGCSELVGLALWLLQERSKVRAWGGLAGWVLAGCGNCLALAAVGWGCRFAALHTLVGMLAGARAVAALATEPDCMPTTCRGQPPHGAPSCRRCRRPPCRQCCGRTRSGRRCCVARRCCRCGAAAGRAVGQHPATVESCSQMAAPAGRASANKQQSAPAVLTKDACAMWAACRRRAPASRRCDRSGRRLRQPWSRPPPAPQPTQRQCSMSRRSWRWAGGGEHAAHGAGLLQSCMQTSPLRCIEHRLMTM